MPTRSPAFVGRKSELATLRNITCGAASHSGSAAFVTGEAGVGKSRLLLEVIGDAAEAEVSILRGRSSDIGSVVPYRALQEILLSAARIVGPNFPPELQPYRRVLARLVPEWADSDGGAGELSSVILGESILRLTASIGDPRGCVLVFDDLHEADPETLAVVEYLVGNIHDQPVSLLASIRSEPSRAIVLAQEMCGRDESVLLPLRRLDHDETRDLIISCLEAEGGAGEDDTARHTVASGIVDRVVYDSAGNPFLTEELLRGMIAAGELVRSGSGWQATEQFTRRVPASVANATRTRIRSLGPRMSSLLSTAAVLGHRFPPSVLARLLEIDDRELIDCVQSAVDAHILEPDDQTLGWYAFQHPLIAATLRDAMGPGELGRLSLAAATVVGEGSDGLSDVWSALAIRLWVAGGDTERAVQAYLDMAGRAAAAGASGSAVELLDEARRALGVPGSSGERRLLLRDVLQALLFALADGGQFERAEQVAGELTLLFIGDDSDRRIDLHLRMAWAAQVAGRPDDGDREVAAARELASGSATEEQLASLDAVEAYLAVQGHDPTRMDRCERLARAAVARAERNALPSIACQAWYAVGYACRERDLVESDSCFRRVLDVSATHHDLKWHNYALVGLGGNAWLESGETAPLRRARDAAFEGGIISLAWNADAVLGLAAVLNGDFAVAERQLDACLANAQRLKQAAVTRYVLMAKVVLAAHRGRRDEMMVALTEFGSYCGEDSAEAPLVHGLGRAFYALLTEDREGAELELAAVAAEEARWQCPFHLAGTNGLAVLLAVLAGREGEGLVQAAAASAAGTMRWNGQFLALSRAVLAGRGGNQELVSEAIAEARSAGELFGLAWHLGLRMVGEAAADEGWGDPVAWLREAEEYFHRVCPGPVAGTCRTLLRRLGKPQQQRRDGLERVPDELRRLGVTGREFEVLCLLGNRLGNKALAARLHISSRTVEKHVASLLVKIGLPHRDGLADLAIEMGTVRPGIADAGLN